MSQIDLSKYPAPEVLESLSYEAIFEEIKTHFISQFPTDEQAAADQGIPTQASILLLMQVEGNLVVKALQAYAYHATEMRARVNDAAKATMLAYAAGTDLDNLAAFYMVERKPSEGDTELRDRLILAVDGFSTAGPVGAYRFHGLSAADAIKDVSVDAPRFSKADIAASVMAQLPAGSIVLQVDDDAGLADPMPGDVAITVLSRFGDGTALAADIAAATLALNDEDVRPLTDHPRTRGATIKTYTIAAGIWCYGNVDSEVVRQAAIVAAQAYADETHRLGYDVTISGLHRALHQPGVQRVEITQPAATIVNEKSEAAYCTSIAVSYEGIDV